MISDTTERLFIIYIAINFYKKKSVFSSCKEFYIDFLYTYICYICVVFVLHLCCVCVTLLLCLCYVCLVFVLRLCCACVTCVLCLCHIYVLLYCVCVVLVSHYIVTSNLIFVCSNLLNFRAQAFQSELKKAGYVLVWEPVRSRKDYWFFAKNSAFNLGIYFFFTKNPLFTI